MKVYHAGLAGFILAFVMNAEPVMKNTPAVITCAKHYVFVLDLEYRNGKTAVENPANWRYIGDFADSIPSCAPGILQACQLIVDERDTELPIHPGALRRLKPGVAITASLNKSG